jgi:hypothetical protein
MIQNLKKMALSIISIISITTVYAQKNEIGVTIFGSLINTSISFNLLEKDTYYSVNQSYGFGLTYIRPINKLLDIETGVEYESFDASVHSVFDYYKRSRTSLLDIPVGLRLNFMKYFYVNGGLLFDLDISTDSPLHIQTGFGSMLGLGLKYDFPTGISLFLNPYVKFHSMLPYLIYKSGDQHILETALKLGISYHF